MRLVIVIAMLLVASATSAQREVKYCGQVEATEWLFRHFPDQQAVAEQARERLEAESQAFEYKAHRSSEPYIIPVVFHVVHMNGDENISDEQIYDAVEILNRDIRKLNADTIQLVDEFAGIAADIEIEFRLAQLDSLGNCTKGITRTVSPHTYEGGQNMRALIHWPRDKYMNVWVCAYASGAAGYTYLPSSLDGDGWGADNDGIVLKHDYTGSIGTSSIGRSRTLTHEVGHWLNLYHTWGPGNDPGNSAYCNDFGQSDQVADTPKTVGLTSCALTSESCGSLDNVQNYMSYSGCYRMFTEGQRDRMQAALESSIADRNQLWQEDNLEATGVLNNESILCAASFEVDKEIICVGDPVTFFDSSFNGPTTWSWDFGDGNVLSGDDEAAQNPVHVFTEPGEYTVSLTVGNGVDEVSTSVEAAVTVLPLASTPAPYSESFEDDSWMDEWFVFNPVQDQQWNDVNSASYSGERCLRLNNNQNDLEDNYDWFESITFDASEQDTVYLSYKWAYVNRIQTTDDRLRIYVSGDCGQSWAIRELHRGFTDLPTDNATNISWTPSGPEDWAGNTIIIDEEGFLTDGMRVKFEFQAKGGNNIYMDDINIFTPESVGVEELEAAAFTASIFPNPSDGAATVAYQTLTGEDIHILVYDATGRIIRDEFLGHVAPGSNRFDLNLEFEGSGMYVVEVRGALQSRRLPLILK